MGLQDFLMDAKNILLGNWGEVSQEDFKREIELAVKSGLISKADAAVLIQSKKGLKAEASEMEKKQLESIVLDDGSVVSKDEAKKKKEELERKKREKEAMVQNANRVAENNINIQKEPQIKKPAHTNGKITIDRDKLQKQIENEEREDRTVKNIGRDEKN